jgi:hypothetical protein
LPGVNAGKNEFCIHSNQRRIGDFGTGPGEWGASIGICTQCKSIWRILSKSLLVYRIVHPPVIQANSSLRHCSQRARESWVRLPGRETLFALFYDEGFVRDVVRNEPNEAEDEARSEGATCGAGGQTPHAVRALSQEVQVPRRLGLPRLCIWRHYSLPSVPSLEHKFLRR